MFGYVIGTLCLVGLIWTLRGGRRCGRRFHGGHGWGYHDERAPWGGGDWGYRDAPPWARHGDAGPYGDAGPFEGRGGGRWARRQGPSGGGGWGWGFRGVEGAIFRRLNATPEQERALGESFDALRASLRSAREAAGKARGDLAAALRQEQVDAAKLGELIARFDASTAGVREAITSALFKAHEVLDVRQRRELAELLEGGFFRRGGPPWGGPGSGGAPSTGGPAGEGGAS